MNISDLTAVVLTFNEEQNIERVLRSLDWLEAVCVVDSYSTDATREICEKFRNVSFFQRKFDNHASQWNFAISLVNTPWLLTLDADHVLDKIWKDAWIKCNGEFDAYLARFEYLLAGKKLRSSLYPPKIVLFRKGYGYFVQDGHTQRIVINGKIGFFPAKIYHDDRKKLQRWFFNQLKYSELEAEKILHGSNTRFADLLRKTCWIMPVLIIPYTLFVRGLIFDGIRGWIYAMQRLIAETLIALLLLEKKLHEKEENSDLRD